MSVLLLFAGASLTLDPELRIGPSLVEADAEVLDVEEDLDISSIAFESEASLTIASGEDELRLEADADYVDFSNPDFTDRWRFRGEAAWTREWSETFTTRLRIDGGESVPTASYFDTGLLRLRARFEYEAQRAHRFRVQTRWREHAYDDDSGTGSGPRIDADYRYRFGRYHYAKLETRWGKISARDPPRRYERYGIKALYTHPLTDTLRVRPALAYLATDFPGRDADTTKFRRDRQWVPEIELLWWPENWRFSAEFQYRWRSSTDRNRDISGPRIELKSAYVF